MFETIIRFPHEIAGVPIFGLGWVAGLVTLALVVRIGVLFRTLKSSDSAPGLNAELNADSNSESISATSPPSRWGDFIAGESWLWAVGLFAIVFLLPSVELQNIDGEPVGMAIRGYGLCLLLAVISAIGLAGYRAPRFGENPQAIFQVAPWAFFGGILGARLFYVIQYRDQFMGDSLFETLGKMANFTQGGLVVYGSFIGGGLAVLYFVLRHRIRVLRMGDVIVPCLFLGLFLGRFGCLMHGCCWGGACQPAWYALEFPRGSPVYKQQMSDGRLIGAKFDLEKRVIESVEEGSIADDLGLDRGQTIDQWWFDEPDVENADRSVPIEELPIGMAGYVEGRSLKVPASELPDRAKPVFPAQIVSSFCGLTLCVLLSLIPPFRFREGFVMWTGFISYALVRFCLEIVRVDEAGQFGTTFSISQWVSMGVMLFSILGIFATRAWKPASEMPAKLSATQ